MGLRIFHRVIIRFFLRAMKIEVRMRRLITFSFLIGMMAMAAACARKEEIPAAEKKPAVRGVQVDTAQASAVEDLYEAVGTVRSKTGTVISSRIMGTVLKIHVREGDLVRPGQLLVELDDRDAAAHLRKARAGLKEAEDMLAEAEQNIRAAESTRVAADAEKNLAASTFKRYRALYERKSVSLQEFEEVQARFQAKNAEAERAKENLKSLLARKGQAQARIEQARAETAQAQLSQGYTRIHAPIQGIVTAKSVEVGVLAAPGAPLFSIEDNTRYRLEVNVEESLLGRIRLDQPVRVRIDAFGAEEKTGRVAEIGPTADPASRSAVIKIDLPPELSKPGARVLRSGFFGRAYFPTGARQVVTLPRKAILLRGQLQGIFVLDPASIARLRLIRTGRSYGERIEVLSGLNPGEKVIVGGIERVVDGSHIQIE